MPTNGTWNLEWLNQNAQRNYPLSEEASLQDISSTFTLPLDLVVDLVWPVHADATVETDKFQIHSISIFGSGVTITIGYDGSPIGAISVASATHTRNQSYFISGTGDFHDSVGKVTVGSLENTMSSAGAYFFDLTGGRLEPTVIRPDLRGVTGIVLVNGDDRSETLTGDIELIAGRNCRLTPISNPGGNSQIRIDAISGEGLNNECDCDNLPETASPIYTINGISPDVNGNFTLSGSDCLTITELANGIKLVDVCSDACCGCEELEPIVAVLQQMEAQITTLEGFTTRMNAEVSAALLNVLASKTGEFPCI